MEENQVLDNFATAGQSDLTVSSVAQTYLTTVRKWAKFFVVLGWIGLVFLVIVGLIMIAVGSAMGGNGFGAASNMPTGALAAIYIVMAGIYVPLLIYLNNFANKMKTAIENVNSLTLEESFKNLKSLFKYQGILTIVVIGIYLLFIVIAAIVGMGAAMATGF